MSVRDEVMDLNICQHPPLTAAGELIPRDTAFVCLQRIPRFKEVRFRELLILSKQTDGKKKKRKKTQRGAERFAVAPRREGPEQTGSPQRSPRGMQRHTSAVRNLHSSPTRQDTQPRATTDPSGVN